MRKIKHNEVVYDVPTDIWELSLEQFIDLYVLYRDGSEGIDFDIKLASIVSGIPVDVIHRMGWATFEDLCEQITWAKDFEFPEVDETAAFHGTDRAIKEPVSFELNGHRYFFQPEFGDMEVGVVAEVERLLAGKDLIEHFHFVLAICARREGEIFDVKRLDEKAALMLKVPISSVYHQLFTSPSLANGSTLILRLYSKASPMFRKTMRGVMSKANLGQALNAMR